MSVEQVRTEEFGRIRKWDWGIGLLLFLLLYLGLVAIHPRVGIRSEDSYGYITGAYSFQAGQDYRDLNGTPLNHWPPGYSLLLSLFPNPLSAARAINYASAGLATAFLYWMSRQAGWHRAAGIGLCLVVGFGLFRLLAVDAKPDTLTYAGFLGGVLLNRSGTAAGRILSYGIWALLIPFKNISAVFIPAAILEAGSRYRHRAHFGELAAGVGMWAACLGGVVAFNYVTIHAFASPGHPKSTVALFLTEVYHFGSSVLRMLLSNGARSLRDPTYAIPFLILLTAGVYCLASLRYSPAGWRRFGRLGLSILALSWLGLAVRIYSADMRLMGYGAILVLLGFRPADRTGCRWLLYGAVAVGVNLYTETMADSQGANHPRYERLVRDLQEQGLPPEPIYSNSYHFLDLHGRVGSKTVNTWWDLCVDPNRTENVGSLQDLPEGSYFLHVTLPAYDSYALIVWPVDPPGAGFREVTRVDGAVLYQKLRR